MSDRIVTQRTVGMSPIQYERNVVQSVTRFLSICGQMSQKRLQMKSCAMLQEIRLSGLGGSASCELNLVGRSPQSRPGAQTWAWGYMYFKLIDIVPNMIDTSRTIYVEMSSGVMGISAKSAIGLMMGGIHQIPDT